MFSFHQAAGSVNLNVAPPLAFDEAHSFPPWASMIERLIGNPIPIPPGLVVKKGSKRFRI
jgi:hypothetical protein